MPKIVAKKIDWIKLGFKSFAKQGSKGIIVETLAKKLQCNRSSFYWHFHSKQEFIDEIIQYWIEKDTNTIIDATFKMTCASDQLKVLIQHSFKADPHIDFIFYLKRYAVNRKDIQEIVDKIDKQRISFVTSIVESIGYPKEEACVKARIFYQYLIGYHEMIKHKKQSSDYVAQVWNDVSHFIKLQ